MSTDYSRITLSKISDLLLSHFVKGQYTSAGPLIDFAISQRTATGQLCQRSWDSCWDNLSKGTHRMACQKALGSNFGKFVEGQWTTAGPLCQRTDAVSL